MKNKIMPPGVRQAFFMLFITIGPLVVFSQPLPRSAYGLPVVNSISLYYQCLRNHPEKEMKSLSSRRAGLFPDLRYAGKNNFTNTVLYREKPQRIYLRKPVILALEQVLQDLAVHDLGLKIFDAYRPYFVTVELWKKVHDSRYAADPAKGSGHNRGIAVDLTLVNVKTGKSLEMPTGFDNFTDSAHQDFTAVSPTASKNRALLKQIMEKHGFIALSTEWWHFSWPEPEKFDVLNLDFNQMKKIAGQ